MPCRNGWMPKRPPPCWRRYVNPAGCGRSSQSEGRKAAGQPGGGGQPQTTQRPRCANCANCGNPLMTQVSAVSALTLLLHAPHPAREVA